MTAREFLDSYKEYQLIADKKKEAYLMAVEKLECIPSSLANIGEAKASGHNRYEDRIIKVQEKKEAWAIAELNALEVRQDVFEVVIGIEGSMSDILIERYIKLKNWKDVCAAVGLSWNRVFLLHNDAQAIVQEKIDKYQ